MNSAQPNQSVIDGFRCLQYIASSEQPVGGRELARALGLDPSRVNRLLLTMAHMGLTQKTAKRKYVTGHGIHVLAAQSIRRSGLFRATAEALEKLAHPDFTTALGSLWEGHVVYLYHARAGDSLSQALGGYRIQHPCESVIGLCLLSQRGDDEIAAMVGDERFGAARAVIEAARRRGFVIWRLADGEVRLATTVAGTDSALAFSRLYGYADEAALQEKCDLLFEKAREISEQVGNEDR
ncbi:helix-turn-helix domain-containing protein [Consotaella salsifontis]|uniref:helix-turn-helix domain-containing protein n=1 Tax=Consotaella salsifontis TaxID=1365950 RepID=UPI0013F62094|nr:helix-turn-helix domain-containing protein [Consotaella salsifontis]